MVFFRADKCPFPIYVIIRVLINTILARLPPVCRRSLRVNTLQNFIARGLGKTLSFKSWLTLFKTGFSVTKIKFA